MISDVCPAEEINYELRFTDRNKKEYAYYKEIISSAIKIKGNKIISFHQQ